MNAYISFLFFAALIATTGCSTVGPSEKDINAEAAKAYAQIKAKSKMSKNPEWNAIVQRVAKRIAKASGEDFQWEYVLIESPEVNAWCMPGGKIAVYTGIMPVLKDEAALAAVLGHEVAHATLRHGKARYARAIDENIVGAVVAVGATVGGQLLCHSTTCKLLSAGGGAAAGFALTFLDRRFSRGEESAADHTGQIYMAKAGYEPSEAIELWKRMAAAQKGAPPMEWMSTHPSDEHRRSNLTEWLPKAEAYYQQASPKYGLGETIR